MQFASRFIGKTTTSNLTVQAPSNLSASPPVISYISPNATVMLDEKTLGAGSHNHITDESVVDKSFSVPKILRKVFAAELGDAGAGAGARDHKLIVIAVHTVLMESGFVGFDETAKVVVDGFQLRNEWPSDLLTVSLVYTLPECVEAAKKVVLKFQSLGKVINVYGITLGDGSAKRGPYQLQLNEDEFVPFLMEIVSGQDGESSNEVLEFWRIVKDNLALPLLIDLCEEAGLQLPPCFMRLPPELKLKILESLRGVDVAKASSVCSELRYLASSDGLWKVKYAEEFNYQRKIPGVGWKKRQVNWKNAYSREYPRFWRKKTLATRHKASMKALPLRIRRYVDGVLTLTLC